MSRRSIINAPAPQETLGDMVFIYAQNKADEKKIKAVVEEYNAKIKEQMAAQGISEYSDSQYKAKVSTSFPEVFNDLQAIEILRQKLEPGMFSSIVKTREYIDQEALEKAVYQKTIDATLLAPCVSTGTPVVKLTISKVKEEKGKKSADN